MKSMLIFLTTLCICQYGLAAHFEHSGGMLWSQVGGWAQDATSSDPYDDPATPWREQNVMSRFDTASVHSYTSSAVSAANCDQDGQFSTVISANTLTISGTAWADAETTAIDGQLNSYAGFSTTQAGLTNGIYFILVADAGENDGDLATIELTFSANGSVTGLGQASFGGGMGASDVLVTVNLPFPAPETIEPQYIAYSYTGMQNTSSFNVSDTASFKVKIGHTVTIFLGADVSVNLGPDYIGLTDMTASAALSLDIVDVNPYTATCDECDLDGSGIIDLGDLGMLAAAWLSEVYPFPPPTETPGEGETCGTAYGLWLDWPESGITTVGQSVWYKYTPGEDNCYTISLCNSEFDTAIELYEECDGYIQGFDDNGCDPQSKLQMSLQAWHTYYLRVRGKTTTDYGYYEIVVTEGCTSGDNTGSDDCEDATQIDVDQTITDDTTGATGTDLTEECGYDNDCCDLWYFFVAPYEGSYDIVLSLEYISTDFAGTLSLFSGCGGEMYACAETDGYYAYINTYLMENEPVWIRVASYESSQGPYELFIYSYGE